MGAQVSPTNLIPRSTISISVLEIIVECSMIHDKTRCPPQPQSRAPKKFSPPTQPLRASSAGPADPFPRSSPYLKLSPVADLSRRRRRLEIRPEFGEIILFDASTTSALRRGERGGGVARGPKSITNDHEY